MRTEPPPSEPGAKGTSPAATAAALPPVEPPELRLRAYGFRDGGAIRFSLYAVSPNSGTWVLPSETTPAAFECGDEGAVGQGGFVVQGGAAVGGHDAGDVRQVLEGHRHPVQQRQPGSVPRGPGVGFVRCGRVQQGLLRGDGDEGAKVPVFGGDAVQEMPRGLPRGQLAGAQGVAQLDGGELMDFSHGNAAPTGSRRAAPWDMSSVGAGGWAWWHCARSSRPGEGMSRGRGRAAPGDMSSVGAGGWAWWHCARSVAAGGGHVPREEGAGQPGIEGRSAACGSPLRHPRSVTCSRVRVRHGRLAIRWGKTMHSAEGRP